MYRRKHTYSLHTQIRSRTNIVFMAVKEFKTFTDSASFFSISIFLQLKIQKNSFLYNIKPVVEIKSLVKDNYITTKHK